MRSVSRIQILSLCVRACMFKLVTRQWQKEKAQQCVRTSPPLAACSKADLQDSQEQGAPSQLHSHFGCCVCHGDLSLCPLFHWVCINETLVTG